MVPLKPSPSQSSILSDYHVRCPLELIMHEIEYNIFPVLVLSMGGHVLKCHRDRK
jgi:hypothetical protein